MQVPVKITWRHLASSAALEARVREHVDHLERFHDGIIACDVVIGAPTGRHQNGAPFDVRIHATVPDGALNVHNQGIPDPAHADAYLAVRDAFASLERMLGKYHEGRRNPREHDSIRTYLAKERFP